MWLFALHMIWNVLNGNKLLFSNNVHSFSNCHNQLWTKNVKNFYLKAEYWLEIKILMGKFYFAFAWDKIVNLHVCICKNKICIWSDQGVNLLVCKYTPVYICIRMRCFLYLSKICTPEYITRVFLAHANWTIDSLTTQSLHPSMPEPSVFM